MKFTFRTDASLQIGTGHVMRCLTLAEALRERGSYCRFICREIPGHLTSLIQQIGFEVLTLPDVTPDNNQLTPTGTPALAHESWLGTTWQTDAQQTIAALEGVQTDWLIIDHYALDNRWETQLHSYCDKVMVIDDLADRKHDCDILLDQNLVADFEYRYDSLVPDNCARLLGPDYALLQPEYAKLHPRTPPRLGPVQRILVYFGGYDRDNLTGRTIAAFLELNRADIQVDVIINSHSPHAAAVRQQSMGYSNITIHEQLPSLAELIVKADLAIGAGGSTTWERCCLGLPTMIITLAENQIPIASEMHNQGFVRWLGHKDTVDTEHLKQALLETLANEHQLLHWSVLCQALLNGKGTERVANIILLKADTNLVARNAVLEDETLILKWANDPLVRQNAFSTSVIDAKTHKKWFYSCLRNPDSCQIYVVETEMGLPIGQVRFELKNNAWEIDFALADYARRRGLGRHLLKTGIQKLRSKKKGAQVYGRVRIENLPSQYVFEALGFDKVHRGRIVYFHMF